MMMRRTGWAILALSLLGGSFALEARADVVGPPPDKCPPGSEGAACHGGPYCRPLTCTTDADCKSGETCTETALCTSSISCAGKLPPDADPNGFAEPNIEDICPKGNECAPAPCIKQKVCITASSASSSGSGSSSSSSGSSGSEEGSCACGAAGHGSALGPFAIAGGLGVAWFAFARRRRRSP